MKVMLVCMAGLTTNILANKLRSYGMEQGYDDLFTACRVGVAKELLSEMDVLLIAPQARTCCSELREEVEKIHCPLLELTEEDLVFGKVEHIYQFLNSYRMSETRDSFAKEDKKLTLESGKRILSCSLLSVIPILLLAIISYVLWRVSHMDLANCIWQISGGIFSLYLVFAVGYRYGEIVGRGTLASAMITLGSLFLLIPLSGIDTYWTGVVRIVNGTIPLSVFGISASVIALPMAFLSILLQEGSWRVLGSMKRLHAVQRSSMLIKIIQGGSVFAVFLMIRILLYHFL